MPPAERKPEPFKELFNSALVDDLARHVKRRWRGFDDKAFTAAAVKDFKTLELKQRANQIAEALVTYLPAHIPTALKLLVSTLRPLNKSGEPIDDADAGLAGIVIWPMGEYVARAGLDHPGDSLKALRELTIRSTAEFAIRPFFVKHPQKTMAAFTSWARDSNHHVRRLVSEGSRPRLPWGLRLSAFVDDPAPLLPLLEALKDDPSDYVRRSVANNLNDIAKDHPDPVASIAARWLKKASPERERLVRHACRTLIKAGHGKTLKALGFDAAPRIKLAGFALSTPRVKFGSHAAFVLELRSSAAVPQKLVLDYVVHHRKKNGGTTPKVFKWKTLLLKPKKSLKLERRHALRPITTRVYYPGGHRIEIVINGRVMAGADFELLM